METVASDANTLAVETKPILRQLGVWVAHRVAASRPTVLSLLVGAAIWEAAGQLAHFSFLPPFSNVVRAAIDLTASGQIIGNLSASLFGLFIGYLLSVVCGITLGLLMGRYRKIEYILDPYLNGLFAAPNIIFIPILFALFGVNRSIQIVVVFLSAFFIIAINTMSAIRTVDASCIEMARSFGAKERQLFLKILLPGAMPLTLAGLRLGMGRAVKGMINGEMFIALFGLGALLRTYGNRFDSEKVFAILLIVVSVALVCSAVVQTIERRLIRWMEPSA